MIEAVLKPADGSPVPGFDLQFFYGGRFLLGQRWATRDHALAHAGERRDELLQHGWSLHW